MKQKIPKSTIKLNAPGRAFRRNILKEFYFSDEHDFKRLDLLANTLDQILECDEDLKKNGLFVDDRFGQRKESPALKSQRDLKVTFCRILRELNLDIQPSKESRPPALY